MKYGLLSLERGILRMKDKPTYPQMHGCPTQATPRTNSNTMDPSSTVNPAYVWASGRSQTTPVLATLRAIGTSARLHASTMRNSFWRQMHHINRRHHR